MAPRTRLPASVTIQVGNPTAGRDHTSPSISAIKLSAKKWRLGKGLAKISKAPVGTTISFSLSEAARATLTFQSAKRGRKSGGNCVQADERQQEPAELHPLRQCGQHQLQRQCRRQPGEVPGTDHEVPETVAGRL